MGGALTAFFLLWMAATCIAEQTDRPSAGGITPGLRNGLLFKPRGHLTLATGTWTAVVRFQQSEIEKQARIIREQFYKIDEALEEGRDGSINSTESVRYRQFLGEMQKMWEHERTWMEAELKAGEAEVRELQTELSLSRQTRGLINALGDGLKWLFGTATEEDTKQLHKDIRGLEAQTGKLHHLAELQATLIGSLSKDQRTNTRNLVVLAKKAIDLERSLAVTRTATHLTLTNIRRELALTNAVSSAIRTASAAVMTFHHEIRRISRAMIHTQQGVVTTTIFPPAILKMTLRAITNHLPEGWVPAVPASTTPATQYKFLGISAFPLNDGWEVHVKIPLKHRAYSQFRLYEVTSVPTHFPNSSLAVKTKLPSKYFAISRDQRLHLEVRQEEINQCRQTEQHTMCQGLTPLIKEKREGCLYHAFRDDHEKAAHQCSSTLVQPEPLIYQITQDKWLYVLPKKETFSVQCADEPQPSRALHLQGTGVFSLPAGCAAMGDRYLVPAHLRSKKRQAGNVQLRDMIHFRIEMSRETFEAQMAGGKLPNQTELQKIVNAVPKDDSEAVTLAELQKKIQDWRKPEDDEELLPGFVHHTSLSLGTLSLIGVIGLVICGCLRGRKPAKGAVAQHLTATPATIHPNQDELARMQSRLARLEGIAGELQEKMEKVILQEAALTNLRKKYDQLTALL